MFYSGGDDTAEQKKVSGLPIEAHLAVYEPERFIDSFAQAGADYIAVHYEAMKEPLQIFRRIREAGAKACAGLQGGYSPWG